MLIKLLVVSLQCGQGPELASRRRPRYDQVSQLLPVSFSQTAPPTESLQCLFRWHREGAYTHLMNEKDHTALEAVRAFNPYDLYSKSDEPCNVEKLRPYYEDLIAKFFPPELDW